MKFPVPDQAAGWFLLDIKALEVSVFVVKIHALSSLNKMLFLYIKKISKKGKYLKNCVTPPPL